MNVFTLVHLCSSKENAVKYSMNKLKQYKLQYIVRCYPLQYILFSSQISFVKIEGWGNWKHTQGHPVWRRGRGQDLLPQPTLSGRV